MPRALDLPHWDVTDKEYAALQEEIARLRAQLEAVGESDRLNSTYTALRSRIAWCQRAVNRYHEPLKSVPVEINILRLGDIAFVTSPFEYTSISVIASRAQPGATDLRGPTRGRR